MRILHCCVSNYYVDGFGYQENILPKINKKDGNNVLIVASTETIINGSLTYVKPSTYYTEYGVKIIRLPYVKCFPGILGRKIRAISQFDETVRTFSPEVILFHGSCGYEIKTIAKYKEKHPNVKLYVDSHEAFYNSARTWISKNILHGILYRSWYRKAMPYIDKVLYIGLHEMYYMRDFMHTPENLLEFYPLGGELISTEDKSVLKAQIRMELRLSDDTLLFVHSGKINPQKKTAELMRVLSSKRDLNAVLIIIGTIAEEIREELYSYLENDSRIQFLGWKSAAELRNYICAADMYLQPGSPSATMQTALCCGTPVMIQRTDFYNIYIQSGGCVPVNNYSDICNFMSTVPEKQTLREMGQKAFAFAQDNLDYSKLAHRLYL